MASSLVDKWCRRPESNRYGLWRDGILSPLRLPIPPLRQTKLEATPGFEPGNKGFAVLCLTTWLCRLNSQLQQKYDSISVTGRQAGPFLLILLIGRRTSCVPVFYHRSGRRDSNPYPRLKGDALPLEPFPHHGAETQNRTGGHADFQSAVTYRAYSVFMAELTESNRDLLRDRQHVRPLHHSSAVMTLL